MKFKEKLRKLSLVFAAAVGMTSLGGCIPVMDTYPGTYGYPGSNYPTSTVGAGPYGPIIFDNYNYPPITYPNYNNYNRYNRHRYNRGYW